MPTLPKQKPEIEGQRGRQMGEGSKVKDKGGDNLESRFTDPSVLLLEDCC